MNMGIDLEDDEDIGNDRDGGGVWEWEIKSGSNPVEDESTWKYTYFRGKTVAEADVQEKDTLQMKMSLKMTL